jgi:hypothetical protein
MAEKDKELTLGERVVNWAKALGLLAAGLAALSGYLKGGEAQDQVAALLDQLNVRVEKHEAVINKQTETIEELRLELAEEAGHRAGFEQGKIYERLRGTEPRKPKTKKLQPQRRVDRSPPAPAPPPQAQQAIPKLRPKPLKGW